SCRRRPRRRSEPGQAGRVVPPGASRGTLAPMFKTRDLRIEFFRPLLPPAILLEELPLTEASSATVARGRDEVARVLRGEDDRLVVRVGPCPVPDPAARTDSRRRPHGLSPLPASDPR